MNDPNPYAPPFAPAGAPVPGAPLSVATAITDAVEIVARHPISIFLIVGIIWIPLELISSYYDAFILEPDDIVGSFWFQNFQQTFIGIIVTAAIINLAADTMSDTPPTFYRCLRLGLSAWLRMWWTSVIFGFVLVFGLVLLILPGIYLAFRLMFLEPIVVLESKSGLKAMRRCWELTRGHFGFVFGLGLALGLLMIGVSFVISIPADLAPVFNEWYVSACLTFVADLARAFDSIVLYCGYRQLYSHAEWVRSTQTVANLMMGEN